MPMNSNQSLAKTKFVQNYSLNVKKSLIRESQGVIETEQYILYLVAFKLL